MVGNAKQHGLSKACPPYTRKCWLYMYKLVDFCANGYRILQPMHTVFIERQDVWLVQKLRVDFSYVVLCDILVANIIYRDKIVRL